MTDNPRSGPTRSVRISDEIWDAAKQRAESEGRTMSDVLLSIVVGYADEKLSLPTVTHHYTPYTENG